MRQIWATGGAWLGAACGLAAFVIAFSGLADRGRPLLVILALVAAAIGLVGGFALLKSLTASAR